VADNALDNLVVAHARCHNDKRAALAGLDPVGRWCQRFNPGWSRIVGLDHIAAATSGHADRWRRGRV
jgi:hypothetical protein